MRAAVREWLTALRIEPTDELALELAVGEAVDNAVEHGFGHLPSGTVVVALQLQDDGRVQVRIDDDGIWRPPGSHARGRGTGLGLIDSLGEDLAVDGLPTGTRVTFTRRLSRPVHTGQAAATPPPLPPAGEQYDSWAVGDDPLVLRVRGPVDALTAERFRRELGEHSRGGSSALTVDLSGVSHLTSVGVAALADLLRSGAHDGSAEDPAVRLVAPTGSPAAFVLDLVGLPREPAQPTTAPRRDDEDG